MTVFKGVVYVADGYNCVRANWYIEEGETIDINGEEMVKVNSLIVTRRPGEWHESREKALESVARRLLSYAGSLAAKAEEVML